MVNNLVDEGDENERSLSEARDYKFIDGDDQKSFSMSIHHMFCIYGILLTHMTY